MKTRLAFLFLSLVLPPAAPAFAGDKPLVTVYKSPTCGCCSKWMTHLEENGFAVKGVDTDMGPIKKKYSVPAKLSSCHTGVVDGYVVEGHVPAKEIKKLLKERPKVTGLAVPGMPIGSPGMEGLFTQDYEVLTFDAQGKTTVYGKYD